ncbi:MAG: hypothetical protein JW982_08835 [Spirochaetes bacterium]|nr:hypothetical protein [Spirochaetota bacterium]
MPTKKKTVKKSAVPKTEPKDKAVSAALLKETTGLLKKLSVNDLKYILQQVKVLIHNSTVKEHNKAVIEEYNKNIIKKQAAKTSPAKPGKTEITIKEGKDGSYFFIRINQKSSSFVLQEMKRLVKISHSGNEKASGISLYNYFKKERSDVIETQHIIGPNDPKLADLAKFLKSKYTTKN